MFDFSLITIHLRKYQINKTTLVFSIGSILIGLCLGYLIPRPSVPISQPLRLGNYKLINPLLACNDYVPINSSPFSGLELPLHRLTKDLIDNQSLLRVGIYFRDLNSSTTITINPDEKFYPASLNKIPILITALKMSESNPNFLSQKISTKDLKDYNQQQEIPPESFLLPDQTYTVQDALNKMIIHSDNNGFYALTKYLNLDTYHHTHNDLRIPLEPDNSSFEDYITPEDFSYFFRVLYNATYINYEYSELALDLMSQVKYAKALRAPIPLEIPVAHKFGLLSQPNNNPPTRQLHDCGIIYYPNHPYLLCVMTESHQPIPTIEKSIQQISQTVFSSFDSIYK